jgi:hypothetical protein
MLIINIVMAKKTTKKTNKSPTLSNPVAQHFHDVNTHLGHNHKTRKMIKFFVYKTLFVDLALLIGGLLISLISQPEFGKMFNFGAGVDYSTGYYMLCAISATLITLGVASLFLSIIA